MMKLKVNSVVALATALAIAGCVSPASTSGVNSPAKVGAQQTPVRQGNGAIQLQVNWPGKSGYGTQAIPNRAAYAVITLKDAQGKAPVDTKGKTIEPVRVDRTYSYLSTYNLAWEFAEQANMKVVAELFDGQDHLVGSGSREFDVIGGANSTVGVDVLVPDAPVLTKLATTSVKLGDTVSVYGSGFGFSKDYQVSAFLQCEGLETGGLVGYATSYYGNYGSIPSENITVVSDEEVKVKIPEFNPNGYSWQSITYQLSNYFMSDQPKKLTLGLYVDGVNSNRLELTMPRTGGASASVVLEKGGDAPAKQTDGWTALDFTGDPTWLPTGSRVGSFSVPVTAGTEWTYDVKDPSYSSDNFLKTVRLTDNHFGATVEWQMPHSSMSQLMYDLRNSPEDTLMGIRYLDGYVQVLADEPFVLPDGQKKDAKHFFFFDYGEACDLWLVPDVGVVHYRKIRVAILPDSSGHPQTRRIVREYRLVGFKQPATSSGN